MHLSDAFDFQLQLSDLINEFPPHTLAQIKARPPLISFKANRGVFEDEEPLTIQQYPYAGLYDTKDSSIDKLQPVNTQDKELQPLNAMLTQASEGEPTSNPSFAFTDDEPTSNLS